MSYGIEVYGMAKSATLRPSQVLQNRIVKTATYRHHCYPTNAVQNDLRILKVNDIYNFKICCKQLTTTCVQ